MIRHSRNLFIVEGEIEENFIEQLQSEQIAVLGRIFKFNLMQKKIKITDSITDKKYDKIFCVLDTDKIETNTFDTLKNNLKMLKFSGPIFLCIQNKNFEDELLTLFECNSFSKLCTLLGIKNHTKEDLKAFITKKHFIHKFTSDNIKNYCSRYSEFSSMLIDNGINAKCVTATIFLKLHK